jgi:TonB family protein
MKKHNDDDNGSEVNFDSRPMNGARHQGSDSSTNRDFNLTLVSETLLTQRLANEVRFVGNQLRQAWPSFRRNPVAFLGIKVRELLTSLVSTISRPHVVPGSATALLLVFTIIASVLILEKHPQKVIAVLEGDDLSLIETIDFHSEAEPRTDHGVGANGKGRVLFDNGRGEGSRPEPARAHGGGGGGMPNQSLQSQGRLPQPSTIPAPIPTTLVRLPPALPTAGIDIDPALWRNLSYASYGDPRSKSTVASNGPGDGGGIGNSNGTGIGEGNGPGFGPGRNGNVGGDDKVIGGGRKGGGSGNNPDADDPDRVYTSPQVTTRARVLFKLEPQYTEEARRSQITGTVILRVVFSRSGQVTNIRAMQSLSGGLTEKAINAARLIRFVPATRNGQPVSMYMQLEYNFNLY